MRVDVRITSDATASSLPAPAQAGTGLQIVQSQEQLVNGYALPIQAASKNLACMLTEMTIEIGHLLLLEGTKLGAETW